MTAQVADVTQPLGSVRAFVKAGNRVAFDMGESDIQNKATGVKKRPSRIAATSLRRAALYILGGRGFHRALSSIVPQSKAFFGAVLSRQCGCVVFDCARLCATV